MIIASSVRLFGNLIVVITAKRKNRGFMDFGGLERPDYGSTDMYTLFLLYNKFSSNNITAPKTELEFVKFFYSPVPTIFFF